MIEFSEGLDIGTVTDYEIPRWLDIAPVRCLRCGVQEDLQLCVGYRAIRIKSSRGALAEHRFAIGIVSSQVDRGEPYPL